jgi:hypothetical protein
MLRSLNNVLFVQQFWAGLTDSRDLSPVQYSALVTCCAYLFIYFISFNVIQPMWLCRQILTHTIADMSERRKQANKQKKTKQHT